MFSKGLRHSAMVSCPPQPFLRRYVKGLIELEADLTNQIPASPQLLGSVENTARPNQEMYFCSRTNEPGKSSEPQTEIAYELDLKGNFTALNRAAAVFSGYSRQELRRMNIAEVLAPECVLPMQHHLRQSMRERFGAVWEVEIVAKNGCRLRLETSAHVVIREGEPVAISGIAYPISSEHSISQIARRSRECEIF